MSELLIFFSLILILEKNFKCFKEFLEFFSLVKLYLFLGFNNNFLLMILLFVRWFFEMMILLIYIILFILI